MNEQKFLTIHNENNKYYDACISNLKILNNLKKFNEDYSKIIYYENNSHMKNNKINNLKNLISRIEKLEDIVKVQFFIINVILIVLLILIKLLMLYF
jgi:hypothetical protein